MKISLHPKRKGSIFRSAHSVYMTKSAAVNLDQKLTVGIP